MLDAQHELLIGLVHLDLQLLDRGLHVLTSLCELAAESVYELLVCLPHVVCCQDSNLAYLLRQICVRRVQELLVCIDLLLKVFPVLFNAAEEILPEEHHVLFELVEDCLVCLHVVIRDFETGLEICNLKLLVTVLAPEP